MPENQVGGGKKEKLSTMEQTATTSNVQWSSFTKWSDWLSNSIWSWWPTEGVWTKLVGYNKFESRWNSYMKDSWSSDQSSFNGLEFKDDNGTNDNDLILSPKNWKEGEGWYNSNQNSNNYEMEVQKEKMDNLKDQVNELTYKVDSNSEYLKKIDNKIDGVSNSINELVINSKQVSTTKSDTSAKGDLNQSASAQPVPQVSSQPSPSTDKPNSPAVATTTTEPKAENSTPATNQAPETQPASSVTKTEEKSSPSASSEAKSAETTPAPSSQSETKQETPAAQNPEASAAPGKFQQLHRNIENKYIVWFTNNSFLS